MRLPSHADDLLTRVTTARSRLEWTLGRRPTAAELAADLEIAEERVTEILRYAVAPLSLSQPLGDDDAAELGDLVEDHAAIAPFDAVQPASSRTRSTGYSSSSTSANEDPPATIRTGSERAPYA